MSAASTFYLAQAALCAKAAAAATLPNQRERALRAQEAWQALADRITLVENGRTRPGAATP
jgi:hypothetical protein